MRTFLFVFRIWIPFLWLKVMHEWRNFLKSKFFLLPWESITIFFFFDSDFPIRIYNVESTAFYWIACNLLLKNTPWSYECTLALEVCELWISPVFEVSINSVDKLHSSLSSCYSKRLERDIYLGQRTRVCQIAKHSCNLYR